MESVLLLVQRMNMLPLYCSEMIKYASNAFLATKIRINEMKEKRFTYISIGRPPVYHIKSI
jgi:hypothetical protein